MILILIIIIYKKFMITYLYFQKSCEYKIFPFMEIIKNLYEFKNKIKIIIFLHLRNLHIIHPTII